MKSALTRLFKCADQELAGDWLGEYRGIDFTEKFAKAVVKDATAAAIVPEGDGYAAALTNFRFLTSAVWTTNEAKTAMQKAQARK